MSSRLPYLPAALAPWKPYRLALLAAAPLLLAACNHAALVHKLQGQVSSLQAQLTTVTAQRDQLRRQIVHLQAQVDGLNNAPQDLYASAVHLAVAGHLRSATTRLTHLLAEYPHGPLTRQADAELAALRQKESQAAQARAGFVIKNLSSYWKTSVDTLNQQSLVVPKIRFEVVNVSGGTIHSLAFRAVFYRLHRGGLRERLGSATDQVAGLGSSSLHAQVEVAAWLTDDTGYTDPTGLFTMGILAGSGPKVVATLSYQRQSLGGSWIPLQQVPVASIYR